MRQKYKQQGFTIIEVMIVLAIAALIMLLVFLAVPALQRSAANTATREDASRLATGVSSFVSNSNGTMPCTGTQGATNDAQTIIQDAGKLSQLTLTGSCLSTVPVNPPTGSFEVFTTNGALGGSSWNPNSVAVIEGEKCSGSTAVTSTQPRQIALLYPVENGGGNTSSSCIQAQ